MDSDGCAYCAACCLDWLAFDAESRESARACMRDELERAYQDGQEAGRTAEGPLLWSEVVAEVEGAGKTRLAYFRGRNERWTN